MLHTSGRCMPSYSYTRLGKEGHAIFSHGPTRVFKGSDFSCIVMSEDYVSELARYVESLALAPLIAERGHLGSIQTIGASSHTSVSIGAVEPALAEWDALHVNSKVMVADHAARAIGSPYGPEPVFHHPGFGLIKETYVDSLSMGMAITVYFLFRESPLGAKVGATLIGIRAGLRPSGVFDAKTTGPFFTEDALNTLFSWERETKRRYGQEVTVGTCPTDEEMQSEYFKARFGR